MPAEEAAPETRAEELARYAAVVIADTIEAGGTREDALTDTIFARSWLASTAELDGVAMADDVQAVLDSEDARGAAEAAAADE